MKCFGPFPLAELPLWQLAQAAVVALWSNRAPAKATVLLWQVSHGAFVMMCRGGLPIAVVPLWQVAHAAVVALWLNRAPAKVTVLLWQVSHGAFVMTCRGGLAIAVVPLWQVAHAAVVPLWLNRAPAKVVVLLWQVSHGAFVAMWRCGLPGALRPSWQEAHRPCTVAWLKRARSDDGPVAESPGRKSLNGAMDGVRPGCPVGEPVVTGAELRVAGPAASPEFCAVESTVGPVGVAAGPDAGVPDFGEPTGAAGAIRARPELPGVAGSVGSTVGADTGAVGADADGENVDVDSGLLLKRTLAAGPGDAVGVATGAGWFGGAEGVGAGGWAAVDVGGGLESPPDSPLTERTAVVTASIALVTTDCAADLTTAMVVGFVAGTSVLAVVTQPAVGCCGLLQLVNVVVDLTWQQPQSCGFALWSGPCAPLVPWLL
jgi:hypothetical protein